jgi:hypothetical protein
MRSDLHCQAVYYIKGGRWTHEMDNKAVIPVPFPQSQKSILGRNDPVVRASSVPPRLYFL